MGDAIPRRGSRDDAEIGAGAVLVVEDDRDARDALCELLRIHGYDVTGASDAQDALNHLHAGLRPCVILLDLMMPGLDGYQFGQLLLDDRALADIPFILCSGHPDLAEAAVELGAAGFVAKPVELERLLELIGRHCSTATVAADLRHLR